MTGFKKLPYSNDFWTIKLGYIELLLTQPKVLNSLTSEEKDNLLLEARKKCSEKLLHDDYSNYGVHFPVRIMASILDMEDYPELITSSNRLSAKKFIENGIYDDVSLFDEIINITDNYINSKNQNE